MHTMALRIGIDLVSVDAVRESVAVHGEHYLARIYTEREVRDCTTPAGPDPERLRPGEVGVPWPEIEVLRRPGGWVELELSGTAARLAADAGISELSLSLTHEAGFASAVVIAAGALQ
jgi:holo-[acyl-carrier protein] synthase